MKHEMKPTKNPNVAIDRNDPEHAKTAIELEWPETFSRRAKMVIRYFEGTMFPFLYNDHIVVTDESLELTAFGDGSPEAPFGFPRYEDNDLRGVELWLEDCADQFDNDGDTPGWEEAKAAFEAEERIATELAHIDKLRRHGAKVVINGEMAEVNSYLWDKAMGECLTKGFRAVAYELRIPETEDKLLLAIFKDGHVSSGSEENVLRCMDEHQLRGDQHA